jgi:hypothetical protein
MAGINITLEVILVVHSKTPRDRALRGQGGFIDVENIDLPPIHP